MTRATLLDDESVQGRYLAVLKPTILLKGSDFSNPSSQVYKISFPYGKPISVQINLGASSTTLFSSSEDTSTAVGANMWFWDREDEEFYYGSTIAIIPFNFFITYEIYLGTIGDYFNRIPTNSSSEVFYYEPLIVQEPSIRQQQRDLFFGFLSGNTGSITLNNADQFFNQITRNTSFNDAAIDLYHCLGDLETANIKKVLTGVMRNVIHRDNNINIQILNNNDILDKSKSTNLYTSTKFSNLDPQYEGAVVRTVFGSIDGFVPVNLDYNEAAPSTSNNRTWGCIDKTTNLSTITRNVSGGSHTATSTNLDSVDGIRVGDMFLFNRAVGTDEYVEITGVGFAGTTVSHAALSGGAMADGDTIERGFVGNIQIVQDGTRYFPRYNRDYTIAVDISSDGVSGFTFTSSMETNLGMSTLSPADDVSCRVYGSFENPSINSNTIGDTDKVQDSSEKNSLTNSSPATIIPFLLREAGIAEADIDDATFDDVYDTLENGNAEKIMCTLATPRNALDPSETYRQIIERVLKSVLCRLTINVDGKWIMEYIGTLGTVSETLDDSDLAPGGQLN